MIDVTDLRGTIVPKSDQLNSEQLLGGTRTITVTDVRAGNEEQPVIVHYEGEDGRPYKPGKTMRKVLIYAWGEDGRQWIGRSMTLFNDTKVRFGGMEVGGIRISHLSHIPREIAISLTATKGKKAQHTIGVLEAGPALGDVVRAIRAAHDKATMASAKAMAKTLTAPADVEAALEAYAARVQELKAPPPAAEGPTFAVLAERINKSPDGDTAAMVLDQALHLTTDMQAELAALVKSRFPD